MRNQTLLCPFSQSMSMNFRVLPQPVGLLKLVLDLCHMIDIQRREFCLRDFYGLHWDTCDMIFCINLGLMLYSTKLYSMNPF